MSISIDMYDDYDINQLSCYGRNCLPVTYRMIPLRLSPYSRCTHYTSHQWRKRGGGGYEINGIKKNKGKERRGKEKKKRKRKEKKEKKRKERKEKKRI